LIALISKLIVAAAIFSTLSFAQSPKHNCAECHADIVASYSRTIMARASAPATQDLVPGEFTHKPSGVHFRVYSEDGKAWMSYERPGDPVVRGKRELTYSIGSGVKGKTFLFSEEGFLFETPINWYSQSSRWNMAPAYTEARQIPMTLPALTDCLNCHTSGLNPPEYGTENLYTGKPFADGGITCERCHGPGAAHASDGKGPIVNPAKLSPERRDAVCMQCHLEGSVAIEQRGRHLYDFRPGENISDYIHYFILNDDTSDKPRATSQFEALSVSVCKQKSGDKMSCTTCHNPHLEPAASDKATYYRGKCLSCHGEAFGAKHHAERRDCASCHMPQLPSAAVAHTEATDHRILKRPTSMQLVSGDSTLRLTSFPLKVQASVRDLALAWQTLAQRGIKGASENADRFLKQALTSEPDDPVILNSAAYVQQERGRFDEARQLYERALKLDPVSNDAATNLGVIEARDGHLARAVQLWQGAFQRAPHRSAIGMNLAMAFCAAGQTNEARRYVQEVLDFNPDLPNGKRLLRGLSVDPPSCQP
jgi:hypothetical protein